MLKHYSLGFTAFLLFVLLAAWSYFGTLDYVTVTQGVVTPSNKIKKKIQHLEGLFGQSGLPRGKMQPGDPLIELEATKSETEFNELETRLAALKIDLKRLEAEQKFESEVLYQEEIKKEHPNKVRKAAELFQIRMSSLQNRILAQKNLVQQKIQDMEEIQQRILKNKRYRKILDEKIEISENFSQLTYLIGSSTSNI